MTNDLKSEITKCPIILWIYQTHLVQSIHWQGWLEKMGMPEIMFVINHSLKRLNLFSECKVSLYKLQINTCKEHLIHEYRNWWWSWISKLTSVFHHRYFLHARNLAMLSHWPFWWNMKLQTCNKVLLLKILRFCSFKFLIPRYCVDVTPPVDAQGWNCLQRRSLDFWEKTRVL